MSRVLQESEIQFSRQGTYFAYSQARFSSQHCNMIPEHSRSDAQSPKNSWVWPKVFLKWAQHKDFCGMSLFHVMFGTISSNAQGLFMTLHSGLLLTGLGRPYVVPAIEPGSTACEASAISAILSFRPSSSMSLQQQLLYESMHIRQHTIYKIIASVLFKYTQQNTT